MYVHVYVFTSCEEVPQSPSSSASIKEVVEVLKLLLSLCPNTLLV